MKIVLEQTKYDVKMLIKFDAVTKYSSMDQISYHTYKDGIIDDGSFVSSGVIDKNDSLAIAKIFRYYCCNGYNGAIMHKEPFSIIVCKNDHIIKKVNDVYEMYAVPYISDLCDSL